MLLVSLSGKYPWFTEPWRRARYLIFSSIEQRVSISAVFASAWS